MPPADRLQETAGVGDQDGHVADEAPVAAGVGPQRLEDLGHPVRADQGDDGTFGPVGLPFPHRRVEFGRSLLGGGERPGESRGARSVRVRLLHHLEVVQGVEQRQQPFGDGQVLRKLVDGISTTGRTGGMRKAP